MPNYRRATVPGGRYFFTVNLLRRHGNDLLVREPGEADFSLRWRLIKTRFSRSLPRTEWLSPVRVAAGERDIWQRHYWEHLLRDDEDYRRHVDYVHVNPLKHGYVDRVADWPYSTFHRLVREGVYPMDWCGDISELVLGGE